MKFNKINEPDNGQKTIGKLWLRAWNRGLRYAFQCLRQVVWRLMSTPVA